MKTRIYFLISLLSAAILVASCVNEEFADPQDKLQVEITGQVFEAHAESVTKTVLDGLAPVWEESDKITVFGSDHPEGQTLTYVGDNKFQTAEGVDITGPYNAIYPAMPSNAVSEDGIFTTVIPSEQVIRSGQKVASGAMVSVASSDAPVFMFKNVFGVVKINIQRSDITSVMIQSSNTGEVIAGTVSVDLDPDKNAYGEEPKINAVKKEFSVTLKPEGEGSTFAPGEYYATVFPRNVAGFKVTFTRRNGESSESISVSKALKMEIVRNGGVNLGTFFTRNIKNAKELLAWNKSVAGWTSWDVVTLTDNIDCAGVITPDNWKMNDFQGVFNGNGKTIDNFVIEKDGPAAFFNNVKGNAVVKNLTFGDGCSVTTGLPSSTENYPATYRVYAATLAVSLSGKASLQNVVNKGSVNTTETATGAQQGNYIGGLAASASTTATITGCENHGSINFSSVPSSWMNCGGLFGEVTGAATLKNCKNMGKVQFSGTNSNNKSLNLGGIVGGVNTASFDGCINLGTVESNAKASHNGGTNIGGIAGTCNKEYAGKISGCINGSVTDPKLGALTNNSAFGGELRMGGFIGYVEKYNVNVAGFKNYAPVTNNGASTGKTALGGVVGIIYNNSSLKLSGCENHGPVVNNASLANAYLGGIVGWLKTAKVNVDDVRNTAAVTNDGSVTKDCHVVAGGIVGYAQSTTGSVTNAGNTGLVSNNKGADKNTPSYVEMGGIVGYIDSSEMTVGDDVSVTKGVQNKGNVSNNAQNSDTGLGGIVGRINSETHTVTVKNCYNSGKISRSDWMNDKIVYVHGFGGILGYHSASGAATLNLTSCANAGEVIKSGGAVSNIHVGGIAGALCGAGATVNVSGCQNSGKVTQDTGSNTGKDKYNYTAGIVAHFESKGKVSGCSNSGTITNKVTTTPSACIRLGGIVANALNGSFEDCSNTGAVIDASKTPGGYVGGIVGYAATTEVKMNNCDNAGDITVLFDSESRNVNRSVISVGGIIGETFVTATLSGCDNSGDIISNCSANAAGAKTAIGGLVGICRRNSFTNCHLSGNITNNCPDTGNEHIGGFVGQIEANVVTMMDNCSVNAIVSPALTTYSGLIVGRLTDKAADGITTTITEFKVAGNYNGQDVTEANFGSCCFGTSSDYKQTTGITFGTVAK